jgi:hypothetical protein
LVSELAATAETFTPIVIVAPAPTAIGATLSHDTTGATCVQANPFGELELT